MNKLRIPLPKQVEKIHRDEKKYYRKKKHKKKVQDKDYEKNINF